MAGQRKRDGNVSKRNLVGGSIMTGCTWGIKLKAMSLIHTRGKRSRPNFKVGNMRIPVIAFCGRYKNCNPSTQNKFNEMLALEKLSLDIELRNLIEHTHNPSLIAETKELCLSSLNDFKKWMKLLTTTIKQ